MTSSCHQATKKVISMEGFSKAMEATHLMRKVLRFRADTSHWHCEVEDVMHANERYPFNSGGSFDIATFVGDGRSKLRELRHRVADGLPLHTYFNSGFLPSLPSFYDVMGFNCGVAVVNDLINQYSPIACRLVGCERVADVSCSSCRNWMCDSHSRIVATTRVCSHCARDMVLPLIDMAHDLAREVEKLSEPYQRDSCDESIAECLDVRAQASHRSLLPLWQVVNRFFDMHENGYLTWELEAAYLKDSCPIRCDDDLFNNARISAYWNANPCLFFCERGKTLSAHEVADVIAICGPIQSTLLAFGSTRANHDWVALSSAGGAGLILTDLLTEIGDVVADFGTTHDVVVFGSQLLVLRNFLEVHGPITYATMRPAFTDRVLWHTGEAPQYVSHALKRCFASLSNSLEAFALTVMPALVADLDQNQCASSVLLGCYTMTRCIQMDNRPRFQHIQGQFGSTFHR
jgi:hypothetical protein